MKESKSGGSLDSINSPGPRSLRFTAHHPIGGQLEEAHRTTWLFEDNTAAEQLGTDTTQHGWHLIFLDRHPHAGSAQHHAAYLGNDDDSEVELVAINSSQRNRYQPTHSP